MDQSKTQIVDKLIDKNPKLTFLETHISWILRGQKTTLKIKKPYDLGFLDFSSLDARKKYCEKEIEYNSLFAPALYKKVVGITAKGEQVPKDHEEIAEYAVEMNTFDESQQFDHLLSAGKLNSTDLKKVAHRLVRYYAKAPKNETIQAFGSPEKIKKMVLDNIYESKPFIGRTLSQECYETLCSSTEKVLEKEGQTLKKRQKTNVKACHGDLHLRNICYYQDKVQLFDCIEFNEQFRNIDQIYDLAFLFMDLLYHERQDLAFTLLNEYLLLTNDFEAMRLLPMYAAIRAVIRGKVTSLLLDQDVSGNKKKQAEEEASKYYLLAEKLIAPHSDSIYCTVGLSGSGKSFVAEQLAGIKGAVILRTDSIRKHLHDKNLYERYDDIYSEQHTEDTYDALFEYSKNILDVGYTIILDGSFLKRHQRTKVIKLAKKTGKALCFLNIEANMELIKTRLDRRKDDVSDADIEVMEAQKKHMDPFDPTELSKVKTIYNLDEIKVRAQLKTL
jgi:aminoglycoside phosphotransferase family enzyme/predicted kinase